MVPSPIMKTVSDGWNRKKGLRQPHPAGCRLWGTTFGPTGRKVTARRRHPAAHHPRPQVREATKDRADLRPRRRRYIVVASRGGAKHHPSWYLNLVEHPEVTIQVGSETFTARARTANADEKPGLWRLMTAIWPDYDRYQAKTDRDIPVVIIEPS